MAENSKLRLIDSDEAMKPLIAHLGVGGDENLENQLIEKSRQEAILKFTPRDAAKRFVSRDSLHEWLSKGRTLHWLIGKDNDLAGLIWYRPSEFPLDIKLDEVPEDTFAIRIYDGYAGHGLARPFMTQSLRVYMQDKQAQGKKIPAMWLQTDVDNPAAIAAYTKFGYKEVSRDEKRVTMVLGSAQVMEITGI